MPRLGSDRGSTQAGAAVAAAALMLLAVVLAGAGAALLGGQAACGAQAPASGQATGTIPASYLTLYQQAGRQTGVPWPVLAGIGEAESDHGRSAAGNTWGGAPIHPASQHTGGYGTDGDHDGQANVYDPADAIPAAAVYLKAHGAPGDIPAAVFAYNHSQQYVTTVLGWAARYTAGGAPALTTAAGPGCAQAAAGPLPPGTAGKVIAYAQAQLGKPYLWGATGPDAFDCSGLAMMAYRAAGITIPRTSQQQWATEPHIPPGHEKPGDLVFFAGSDGTMTAPGHVGIVTSKGMMIDAPQAGETVRQEPYGNSTDLVGFARPASG